MRYNKKARVDHEDISPEGGYKIKEYHPTMEQMKDFSAYIKLIHEDNGHRAGLAKIIPPKEYVPRKNGYADDSLYNMDITSPIKQEVSGEKGLYQQLNLVEKKKISVRAFKKLAEEKYTTPEWGTMEDLERTFWKNIFTQPSIYGADVSGSLYDPDVEEFNLTKLNTILDNIGNDYGVTIQGVNTAYLYFGMWKTSFCWHTEDMDLYSINYLHEGAPKAWYCISPEHGKRFERLAASFFPHSSRTCRAFLRHKTTLISPQVLKKYSIPYSKCLQHKGQFMITFPYSYHSGFNVGFNIAEATNFALEYWIDFGKWATRCECSSESVKISMQTFVKRYQADRYEKWLQGKDVCQDPRDPKHVAAAPKPTEYDLYLMGTQERDHDEEENQKDNALQLIQPSDVKIKTKAARKSYPSLEDTYQRYNEFLHLHANQANWDTSLILTHYSPYSNNISSNQEFLQSGLTQIPQNGANESCIDNSISEKKIMIYNIKQKTSELKKRQKDEKVRIRKEKRQKEAIVAANQLLQFLPLTFTHEKRFNRCIAPLAPHCSVCQLLEMHPQNNVEIWGDQSQTPCPQTSTNNVDTSTACDTTNVTDPHNSVLSSSCTTPAPIIAGSQVEEFKLPDSSPISLPRGLFNSDFDLPSVSENPQASPKKSSPSPAEKKPESPPPTTSQTTETEEQSTQEAVKQTPESSISTISVDINIKSEPIEEKEQLQIELYKSDKLEFLDIDLESSPLMQCSVCMLCVHKTCYGLTQMPQEKADWICDRCVQKNRSLINCELCPCRGGALKEYDGTWFHLTCALFIPTVRFIDLITKKSKISNFKQMLADPDTEKNSCVYCTSIMSRYVHGRLVSCFGYLDSKGTYHNCSNTFHPTCGHRNGAKFDYIDFCSSADMKLPIRATCSSCLSLSDRKSLAPEKNKFASDILAEGTRVVALASSNGLYYDAIIKSRQMATYYDVYFPELNETDVYVRECRILNLNPCKKFQVGDEVKLRNTKSKEVRTGKFKNQHIVEEYYVQFDEVYEEGRGLEKVLRKNIYLNVDQMPEELLRRFRGKTTTFKDDKRDSGEPCVIAAEEGASGEPLDVL